MACVRVMMGDDKGMAVMVSRGIAFTVAPTIVVMLTPRFCWTSFTHQVVPIIDFSRLETSLAAQCHHEIMGRRIFPSYGYEILILQFLQPYIRAASQGIMDGH